MSDDTPAVPAPTSRGGEDHAKLARRLRSVAEDLQRKNGDRNLIRDWCEAANIVDTYTAALSRDSGEAVKRAQIWGRQRDNASPSWRIEWGDKLAADVLVLSASAARLTEDNKRLLEVRAKDEPIIQAMALLAEQHGITSAPIAEKTGEVAAMRRTLGSLTLKLGEALTKRDDAEAEAARLTEDNKRLREALEQARDWFREYQRIHLGKFAEDKARRNGERADYCDATLTPTASGKAPAAGAEET